MTGRSPASVIIQARASSQRLPAKVLLPIGGYPLCVLAALRAGNRGREVTLATSREAPDDLVARAALGHGIRCHRGDLANVLLRFVSALADFDDEHIIVRLTADNVVPDGALIDTLIAYFEQQNGAALAAIDADHTRLPYGVSAEVTRAGYLREALASSTSPHDLEHVTAFIRQKYGCLYLPPLTASDLGHLRSTIDTFEDYSLMANVMTRFGDPRNVSAFRIVEALSGQSSHGGIQSDPGQKFILGGAQLGMVYGINSASSEVGYARARDIVRLALESNITTFDVAQAYGEAEDFVGEALAELGSEATVITKLDPAIVETGMSPDAMVERVDARLLRSANRLRRKGLHTVLLHRHEHYQGFDGAVWSRLLWHRKLGFIDRIGLSVQSPQELLSVVDDVDIDLVQLPFNLLDWRWDEVADRVLARKAIRPIDIHARSALLQGLLLSRHRPHWQAARVADPAPVWSWLDDSSEMYGMTPYHLALAFVASQPWIDKIVCGVDSADQLAELTRVTPKNTLSDDDLAQIRLERPFLTIDTLNPANWLRWRR